MSLSLTYPFIRLGRVGISRPMLPIKIINPESNRFLISWGLIDTGADECALPATYADILGHNLQASPPKKIATGNGSTNSYPHTTRINIFKINGNNSVDDNDIVYTIQDTPIDFMPNLNCILLGVKSFLSELVLTINYPKKYFNITKHEKLKSA